MAPEGLAAGSGRANLGWNGSASDTYLQKDVAEIASENQGKEEIAGGIGDWDEKARAYLKFDLTTGAGSPSKAVPSGQKIIDASMGLTQYEPDRSECAAVKIWARRATEAVDYATLTWDNQPASHVESGREVLCAPNPENPDQPDTAMVFDLTEIVQHWSSYPAQNWGFKVMIDTEQEVEANEDSIRWWRSANFVSGVDAWAEPHLFITYNERPSIGAVTLTPAAQSGLLVSPTTQFSAPVSDPGNEQVRLRIDVDDLTSGTSLENVYSPYVASGQTATVNLPTSLGLVVGHKYRFLVRASDGVALSHLSDADGWFVDLVYDGLPTVDKLSASSVADGSAVAVGPPTWYEALVSDVDSGQQLSTEFTLKQGSTVVGSKTVTVSDALAQNEVRWSDPPTSLTTGLEYTLSVRVANAGRDPLVWSAVKTLTFTVNDAPAFSEFKVDGQNPPAWRTTPVLSAKVADGVLRTAVSARVEVFNTEPGDDVDPLGEGPAVLEDGVAWWRPPPGLLTNGNPYWARFSAEDQHGQRGVGVFPFAVDSAPAVIPADAVSISPRTTDGHVSALDPVIAARVFGDQPTLVLQVQIGDDVWTSDPVASSSSARVHVPAGHSGWGKKVDAQVRAADAGDHTPAGPWTPISWQMAAEPGLGAVTVTPSSGGVVTSDQPVISAAISGSARDLGASFTASSGSLTVRSGWVPADRGQVSWQLDGVLAAGEQVAWTVVASYRLGSSGDQQEGQFSTGTSLFTPAGLAVSPRSVAGTVSSAHPTFSAWVGGDPGALVQVVFHVNGQDVATVDALTGTRVEFESTAQLSGSVTWSVTAALDGEAATAAGPDFTIDTGVVCAPMGKADR